MKKLLAFLAMGVLLAGSDSMAVRQDMEEFDDPDSAIGYLTNEYEGQREKAAEYLGDVRSEKAVNHLIKAMDDPSDDVREQAAESLGNIGSKDAVDVLIKHLRDGDGGVRGSSAQALADIGDPRALEPMKKQLDREKNPFTKVRIRNAWEELSDTAREQAGEQAAAAAGEKAAEKK